MLFTFPSRYWFTIGRVRVLRLGGWSPHVQTRFHVPRPTQGSPCALRLRGYHPLRQAFPGHSGHSYGSAGPRSLAATEGVSVDFLSSGYLDVSVPRVRSKNPMYSSYDTYLKVGGFPHSEISGSKDICRLPGAFRRLSRLSSPLTAKASTTCT